VARIKGTTGVESLQGQIGGQLTAVEVIAQLVLQRIERIGERRKEARDLEVFVRHQWMMRRRRQRWQKTA